MGEEVKKTEEETEETKSENTESYRNPDGTFAEGNPGRPVGSLNFSTKWRKFIEKVAEQNETTPNAVDEQMLRVAYRQIMNGDHRYWKDIMDRVYGQAKQPIGHEFDENISAIKVEIINGTKNQSDIGIQQDKPKPSKDSPECGEQS